MPTTSPRMFRSARLPGLMATSVWITARSRPCHAACQCQRSPCFPVRTASRWPIPIHSPAVCPRHRSSCGKPVAPIFDHSDVAAFVGANNLGLEFALVGQRRQNLVRTLTTWALVAVETVADDEARSPRHGDFLFFGAVGRGPWRGTLGVRNLKRRKNSSISSSIWPCMVRN